MSLALGSKTVCKTCPGKCVFAGTKCRELGGLMGDGQALHPEQLAVRSRAPPSPSPLSD